MASGTIQKATPRVCWQPGPAHVSLVISGQSRQNQRRRQHRGHWVGVLAKEAPEAYSWGGPPSLRASSSSGRYYLLQGENWVFLSFCVFRPRSREDRISPRKQFLCEVWVPEMRITSLEVPQGVKASRAGVPVVGGQPCNHVIAEKCTLSQADPAHHLSDTRTQACCSSRQTSVSTFVKGQKLHSPAQFDSQMRWRVWHPGRCLAPKRPSTNISFLSCLPPCSS